MKMKTACLTFVTAVLLVSCDKKKTAITANTDVAAQTQSAALTAVFAAAPAGEPKAIHRIRATAKPGDEITVRGKIMGNANPFVDGRAAFILGDPEVLTACNERPGDNCDTPWDNCCDSPEDKKRGTATLQIVDANGRVLKEPLEGVAGIKKLANLTVTGIVAEGSSRDLLIINAKAIQSTP